MRYILTPSIAFVRNKWSGEGKKNAKRRKEEKAEEESHKLQPNHSPPPPHLPVADPDLPIRGGGGGGEGSGPSRF